MMHFTRQAYWILLLLGLLLSACAPQNRSETRLLVFSKTKGYRHQSIAAGQAALFKLGQEQGFAVDTTENAEAFTEENLARYSAVVFLNTTGDVLDHRQQADFERYIQAGGGYVGIHSATDTEYDWPWYNRLAGAYFISHPNNPNVREGMMQIVKHDHPSTEFLKGRDSWKRTDEFYNFKSLYHGDSLSDGIVPLILIDEKSYEGGENGDFHPMSWFHEFDGGRAFYTNFGHTDETFSEADFLQHLLGGIRYAVGKNRKLDYRQARSERVPDPSRFVITVLDEALNEPMELAILPGGRVLFTERGGNLNLHDPSTGETRVVGRIAVHTKHEDGLVGLALDPNFAENSWLYMYYSPAGEEPKFVLSRFTFKGDSLVMASEKVLLEVPTQRDECCHTGGSIAFGPDGSLFLSTGDNTNPFETGYAPINETPGRSAWDAQKSSGSPGDLRGKVLRIKPTPQGGYSIPDGNLFPKDGSGGRPEIYTMGCRNPYRISVDQATGWLYWGDVGPDANNDSTLGSRGYDEVNQAKGPGFFGWPYFIGNNQPQRDFDFIQKQMGDYFNPIRPVNNSPNNKGPQALPPAQPAFIWYPYAESPDFPIVGKGGRNAMAGPVFHKANFAKGVSTFPNYYENKLFIYDFMRDWVLLVTMDDQGKLQRIEPFLSDLKLSSPMDMEFGPDGALYILEYGTRWFAANPDARLIRIDYAEGNRAPVAQMRSDRQMGAAPMTVQFSAQGSFDYDKDDALRYRWDFGDGSQGEGLQASHTYAKPGKYEAVLTISDSDGKTATRKQQMQVGNEPPRISVKLSGNRTFFWKEMPLQYVVDVSDQEDGSLSGGQIPASAVAISFDFLDNTEDATVAEEDHASVANASLAALGENLISVSGCIACHGINEQVQGPAYMAVSQRYKARPDAVDYLVGKILKGGSGVWGGNAMPAQSQLSEDQARAMAIHILSLSNPKKAPAGLSAAGKISFAKHKDQGQGSTYQLRVSYTDKGGEGIGPVSSKELISFRSPWVAAAEADIARSRDVSIVDYNGITLAAMGKDAAMALPSFDLSGISGLMVTYAAGEPGALLQLREGSPEGVLLAEARLSATGLASAGQAALRFPALSGQQQLFLVVSDPSGKMQGMQGILAALIGAYFLPPAQASL
jgi:cytochrome c